MLCYRSSFITHARACSLVCAAQAEAPFAAVVPISDQALVVLLLRSETPAEIKLGVRHLVCARCLARELAMASRPDGRVDVCHAS